jgi:asparagine N-glycosylation enzyme membrane subunit Stt3
MHAFMPIDRAGKFAAWIASAPVALVRLIGVVEIAGALGVVLPAAIRVKPWLTPLAAAGLALIMLLAMPVHLMRGEAGLIDRNVLALLLAAFVVWGRTTRARISERDS